MIKVRIEDGLCEFPKGDTWIYRMDGRFVEIEDDVGRIIASFNSDTVLWLQKG